ncbi:hypothetical protein HII36_18485 [Nonomuraea sp. NN258]|uniref:hypothetical protein n=1 Tax=Nonomuraea antri TaxID=2730852 RepID=UPI0015693F4D|nr:hypothetical protein [Nonomuraea antri]NRQ33824.1 hypothetical protein [Nonomuraea antri]
MPGPDRFGEALAEVLRGGVVWRAYAFAVRHLIRLLAPALLVFLPIGLLAAVALIPFADGTAALVDGDLELIGLPGSPLLTWAAALVVSLAGHVVALRATMVIAAGRLAGEHVPTSAAMRAALRRSPATIVLGLIGVVMLAAALVASARVLLWTDARIPAYAVLVVLVMAMMPVSLAVASVVLEGRSAGKALGRAYRLTGGAPLATSITVAFGVVIFPVLAARAAGWALSGVPVAPVVVGSVLGLVTVPFQAAVITRLFLHRLAMERPFTEFTELVAGLPTGAPRPARPVRVLAALLLPNLLYGGVLLINPLGWPEVSETVVTEDWSRHPYPGVSARDGRPLPSLGTSDLRLLQTGPDGRMVMLMDDDDQAKILTCLNDDCTQLRYRWAEAYGAAGGYLAAGARLADGRLVVSTWTPQDGSPAADEDRRVRLDLLICDATGCAGAPGGRPVAEVEGTGDDRWVALATRPGGGLLIALLAELEPSENDVDTAGLSIITCDDPLCTRPRAREVAKLPVKPYLDDGRGLVAGVGPDDRPVVSWFDRETGSIFVISCDDPACVQARMGRHVRPDRHDDSEELRDRVGAAMAVRPDGRPLIAYLDVSDGAVKLLDCHTRECARAGTTTVAEPGQNANPAMVLDRDGRALVAYQDLARRRIVIATCASTGCTRTAVATIRRRGGEGLALTLDGAGRPVIAWMDAEWSYWDLVLTRLTAWRPVAGDSR